MIPTAEERLISRLKELRTVLQRRVELGQGGYLGLADKLDFAISSYERDRRVDGGR